MIPFLVGLGLLLFLMGVAFVVVTFIVNVWTAIRALFGRY